MVQLSGSPTGPQIPGILPFPAGERGVIAGAAAVGVMAVTMPLEVVARRMQVKSKTTAEVKA